MNEEAAAARPGPPRKGVRVPAFMDACFEAGGEICEGQIVDLAVLGARIEVTEYVPPVGEQTKLVVGFSREDRPVELSAVVVRHPSEHSFAVEFKDPGQNGLETYIAESLGNALMRRPRIPVQAVVLPPAPVPRGAFRRWLHRLLLRAAARLC